MNSPASQSLKKFYSYVYGEGDNKNTFVTITKGDQPKIICASEKQNPIVFDFESRNLLIECESPFIYEKIESISSSMLNKFFIVKGMDNSGQSQAVIFSLKQYSNSLAVRRYN